MSNNKKKSKKKAMGRITEQLVVLAAGNCGKSFDKAGCLAIISSKAEFLFGFAVRVVAKTQIELKGIIHV